MFTRITNRVLPIALTASQIWNSPHSYCSSDKQEIDSLVQKSLHQVSARDAAGFKKTFTDLCKQDKQSVAAKVATNLLAEQEPKLLQPVPKRESYEFILKHLKQIQPEINSYFSKGGQKENGPTQGLGIHAISSKGQKFIMDAYKENNALNGKTVHICGDFPVFQQKLAESFTHIKEGEDQLFLVRHRADPSQIRTRHTSPVHIRRKDNMIQVFITDSTGGYSSDKYVEHLIEQVQKAYEQSGLELPIEINHDGGSARLGDGSNCVVLAIREGLEMIRDTENVYEWINKTRINKGNSIYAVPYLPLRMVKNAQSMTYINKYLDATKQHATQFTSKSKPQGQTVAQSLQKHQFIGTDPKTHQVKICNGKIAHTYLKYEREIVSACIKKMPS